MWMLMRLYGLVVCVREDGFYHLWGGRWRGRGRGGGGGGGRRRATI